MLDTSTIRKVEDSIAGGGELVLRLALGITFFAHGRHKIKDPNAFATFLRQLGVPAPQLSAWSVALLETVGAACLMLGIGARPIAIGTRYRYGRGTREGAHPKSSVHFGS